MGRRKSSAKAKPKKKQPTVAKTFKCLFCSQEGSVSCKMDFNAMIGELKCRVCDEVFETTITALSDPIDVFSEWLDETSDLQIKANKQLRTGPHPSDRDHDDDEDGDGEDHEKREEDDRGDALVNDDEILKEFDD